MSVFSKLIPAPQDVVLGEGTYKLTSKTVKTNFDATNDFKYLLGELGLPVASICDCKADFLKMVIGEGCITDATAPENKEGYTLVLRENGAEITANTKEGIAFGLKTLIKLQESNVSGVFNFGSNDTRVLKDFIFDKIRNVVEVESRLRL